MSSTPFRITKYGIVGNLTGSVQGTASYAVTASYVEGGDSSSSPFISGTGSGSAVLSGSSAVAVGRFAVAEGIDTKASGNYSHAEGHGTIASNSYEHAQGVKNATASGQIFSIGCGDSITRKMQSV